MVIYFLVLIFMTIGSTQGDDQYYDGQSASSCSSFEDVNVPGTRYTCNSSSSPKTCKTFLIFRANSLFDSVEKISTLFRVHSGDLLAKNNVTAFEILNPGREVVIPVTCSCIRHFYEVDLTYVVPGNMTFSDIACGVFEGLSKSAVLSMDNIFFPTNSTLRVGSTLRVPLKCACPDNSPSLASGMKYLVTYPFIENDTFEIICKKFNIHVGSLFDANHVDSFTTVYQNTTILVPLRSEPPKNFNSSSNTSSGFVPTEPVEKKPSRNTQLEKVYISVAVVGFFLVLVTSIACGLYVKALRKCKAEKRGIITRKSSMTSCSTPSCSQLSGPTPHKSSTGSPLSPDLLESIKYSVKNYSLDEIKKGTNEFSEENRVMDYVYKGCIDGAELLIRQTRFEDTKQVIDVHSKLNHVQIVKLQGVCYGDDDDHFSWCYLVFDFPGNGSLRECLSKSNSNPSLKWKNRTQIASDVATGLHYLHFCVVPPYTHKRVSSKTIFLTKRLRARIAVFEAMSIVGSSKDHDNVSVMTSRDFFDHKEDILAFGVVLLELISGKDDSEEEPLAEAVAFLGGGGGDEGGCFDQLRKLVDDSLEDEYPLAEALCLAVLAKACIEEDPLHRPSMDDVLKVLSRMV